MAKVPDGPELVRTEPSARVQAAQGEALIARAQVA
jgi:hypothetical protein